MNVKKNIKKLWATFRADSFRITNVSKSSYEYQDLFCKLITRKAMKYRKMKKNNNNGILLPKLFRPTVRKNSDREKLLKFEAE